VTLIAVGSNAWLGDILIFLDFLYSFIRWAASFFFRLTDIFLQADGFFFFCASPFYFSG